MKLSERFRVLRFCLHKILGRPQDLSINADLHVMELHSPRAMGPMEWSKKQESFQPDHGHARWADY